MVTSQPYAGSAAASARATWADPPRGKNMRPLSARTPRLYRSCCRPVNTRALEVQGADRAERDERLRELRERRPGGDVGPTAPFGGCRDPVDPRVTRRLPAGGGALAVAGALRPVAADAHRAPLARAVARGGVESPPAKGGGGGLLTR